MLSAISHTWGRWRVKGEGVSISKVPWPVPQNTRFFVEELPEILARHKSAFETPYIWLDLFCIPRDRSERAAIEISRQAAISGAAARAIVWLNDVDNWDGLHAAIKWLILAYLKDYNSKGYDVEQAVSDAAVKAVINTQLFEAYDHSDESTISLGTNPSGWFASLWTLQ